MNESGDLVIPASALGDLPAPAKFEVQRRGDMVVLVPIGSSQPPVWERSKEEWAESIRQWANQPRPWAPDIPLEAMSRENIYP